MPIVDRHVLKGYLERGDRPTQSQFATIIDSMVNIVEDRYLLGLREYDPQKLYLQGDTMIYSNSLYVCVATTTGVFDPTKWEVIASFGSVVYSGTWNATTNSPTLADGTGTKGFYYVVSVGGNRDLGSGTIDFQISDWVIYNGTIWQKVDNSQAPVIASDVAFTPNGDITSTNVQDAVVEVRNKTDIKLAAKQNLITLTPNYYPFADSANTLADGSILNEVDGVVLDSGKVFRSIIPGKSQIDFPAANSVIISTDGGVAAESLLTLDPDFASLKRTSYGELSITSGTDTNGEIILFNNVNNGLSINTSDVELKNTQGPGAFILIADDGSTEIEGSLFKINPATQFLSSTASTVPYLDNTQTLVSSAVTPTELGYLSGVSSAIQTQLNGKVPDSRTVNGHALTADVTVTKSDVGLGNVTNDQQLSLKIYFADEVTVSTSTSSTFATVYTNTFNLVDSGNYIVSWYYEIGQLSTNGDVGTRVLFDASVISMSALRPGVAATLSPPIPPLDYFMSAHGFIQRTALASGFHTFLIELNRPTNNGTALFRRPRFTLTKI